MFLSSRGWVANIKGLGKNIKAVLRSPAGGLKSTSVRSLNLEGSNEFKDVQIVRPLFGIAVPVGWNHHICFS